MQRKKILHCGKACALVFNSHALVFTCFQVLLFKLCKAEARRTKVETHPLGSHAAQQGLAMSCNILRISNVMRRLPKRT